MAPRTNDEAAEPGDTGDPTAGHEPPAASAGRREAVRRLSALARRRAGAGGRVPAGCPADRAGTGARPEPDSADTANTANTANTASEPGDPDTTSGEAAPVLPTQDGTAGDATDQTAQDGTAGDGTDQAAQDETARDATDQTAQDETARDATDQAVGGPETGPARRVSALRRAATAARGRRALHYAGCAALLALALTGGSIALGAVRDTGAPRVAPASAAVSPGLLASGDLDAGIASLQAHLRDQPRDFGSWSALGLAYVEQARTKGDPARYPQAEQAFRRSLALRPGNDAALAGRAALAAARHDFEDALALADRALEENPYNERALCTRIDALLELGRYADASKAADIADDRRPGIPVFTRYAYVRELRGDVRTAERVLKRALSSAVAPGDIAYVATQLGQLAWNQGDYESALGHYARALAADENYVPALEGRARARAANGDRAGALAGLADVVSRFPLPGPLVELGELYEASGDRAKADEQYALVDAWTALARANGANTDLETALAAADHGDRRAALRAARAEWDRRRTVHTADALAWALHVNGKDEEALPYARRATATGYRNASFLYHRGIIERAAGNAATAREQLRAALELNPGFSPLGARKAREALAELEAAE